LSSFNANAHGKGAVDGIGAAMECRTTRTALSGVAADATCIFIPEDLQKFVQKDSSMNVFYLNEKPIKSNGEKCRLS
jgi:hypothetical protein